MVCFSSIFNCSQWWW